MTELTEAQAAKEKLKERKAESTADLKATVTKDLIENKYNTLLNEGFAKFAVKDFDNSDINFKNTPADVNNTFKSDCIKYSFRGFLGKVSAVRSHVRQDAKFMLNVEYRGEPAYKTVRNYLADQITERLEELRVELLGELSQERQKLISRAWSKLQETHKNFMDGDDALDRQYQSVVWNYELYRIVELREDLPIAPRPQNKVLYGICKLYQENDSLNDFKSIFSTDAVVSRVESLLGLYVDDKQLIEDLGNSIEDLKVLKRDENWQKVRVDVLKFYRSR